jgi:pimeloyl-ACP methyl ester carboxylesterase
MQLRRSALAAGLACAITAIGAPAAIADKPAPTAPRLTWKACGDAPGVTCATATVPADYGRPRGETYRLHVAKSPATDQAHRIGSLFINFGGPGGTAADTFEAGGADVFPGLNKRFDIIAMDPRGVGQSSPSIDCKANQETEGIYSQPFPTPENLDVRALIAKDSRYVKRCLSLNGDVLRHVSTANVARDVDLIRQGLGESKITYFGYSYGTFLGATYANLFPTHYREMVLDGPVDADAYINDPLRDLSAQTSGFERALGRFLAACAHDAAACRGFGAESGDPGDDLDQLLERLDQAPIPSGDGRTVDGDDARAGAILAMYTKRYWPLLAQGLADAEKGDGGWLRALADAFYGSNGDGTYDPAGDRYFTIGAAEQDYPRDLRTYLRAGQQSWDQHEHFWFNNGYVELNYGLYPVRDRDAFDGPFRLPRSAVTPLVVGTTYDPATPYRGARNLVRELGDARLLTMRGDGHTAYGGESSCIDAKVEAYLEDGTLPPAGTQCRQQTTFSAPVAAASRMLSAPSAARVLDGARPHVAPLR